MANERMKLISLISQKKNIKNNIIVCTDDDGNDDDDDYNAGTLYMELVNIMDVTKHDKINFLMHDIDVLVPV